MADFYITTAIDYVNGSPHIGHAYEKILTDVIARFRRLMGDRVYFLTGHGRARPEGPADGEGEGRSRRCSSPTRSARSSGRCSRAWRSRTTTSSARPRSGTRRWCGELLQHLFDKGDIYKGEYRGFYSTRQEQFLQEKDRNPDGSWPEIYGEVTEIVEPNYFFKLRPTRAGWSSSSRRTRTSSSRATARSRSPSS